MLPVKISGACVTLPTSQFFIKIINIPYFKPSTTEPPNGQEISDQLISSPIPTNLIKHAQFAPLPPLSSDDNTSSTALTVLSKVPRHTPAPPSVNDAGNGATPLMHADAQLSTA
ncbi:hypothetical protein P691DRAFT_758920 [Macrolepiota fuliginosa MF-IS2]|uniref:Uncharacterized protein n=1 Tax=Macrolepiota fuliginosa MF-IS2 TaxID=1400762 RepID=A0A9P6C5U7_9AGAR|nr:hypothetical protein P691DRAFT_758920 [Macrolepiota fuliginosa MF-IS2]